MAPACTPGPSYVSVGSSGLLGRGSSSCVAYKQQRQGHLDDRSGPREEARQSLVVQQPGPKPGHAAVDLPKAEARTCELQSCLGPCLLTWGSRLVWHT